MSSVQAQALALMLKGAAPQAVPTHPMMVRVPYDLLASLDVMRERSGKSRNEMACQVLGVGVAEVVAAMDAEDAFHFVERRDELELGYRIEDQESRDQNDVSEEG